MDANYFVFDAGNLALDLVNTRPVSDGVRQDLLTGVAELDAWLAQADLAPQGSLIELGTRLADRVLIDARALRDAIEELLDGALSARSPPSPSALAVINAILDTERSTTRLEAEGTRVVARTIVDSTDASSVLRPVAVAAVSLLTEVETSRVRQCDDPACVLWFVDVTKNRSRRWCSMERCGNRAKVAAHYRRARGER